MAKPTPCTHKFLHVYCSVCRCIACFKCRDRHMRSYSVPEHMYWQVTQLPVDQRQAMDAEIAAFKCTVCTGHKVGAKEMRRQKRAAFEAAKLQREHPEVVLELEVMFHALAAEMAPWADAPRVDHHGDSDGNNPHVFFPVNTLPGQTEQTASAPLEWREFRGVARRVYPQRFDQCPCGLRYGIWWGSGFVSFAYFDGIWRRDVQ